MRRYRSILSGCIAICMMQQVSAQAVRTAAVTRSNVSYVDPTIGGVGIILEPTRPTVHLPNSMLRTFPFRKDQLDDRISYFPLMIAAHRQNNLFGLMPVSGDVEDYNWLSPTIYDREQTTPYYYSAYLEDTDQVEFTPAAHSGYFRFHFNGNIPHAIRINVLNGDGDIAVSGKRAISGKEVFEGMTAFFYGELNTDIVNTSYRDPNGKTQLKVNTAEKTQVVEFRYGVSFVSVDQAKENLQKEIPNWDFAAIKQQAYNAWDKVLGQIDVKGGTLSQKKVFYTSLYRAYERMVNINEYGKYYSAYDHTIHTSDQPFYVDNWLWDTYIALEPLQTLLNPKMEADKIRSYVQMYEQSGWMPSFALPFGDYACMTGNHAAAWMADAWFKGIHDFDLPRAYEGLKKNALEATLLPWRNGPATSLDSFYGVYGYMPALKPNEKETVKEVHDFERR